MFVFVIVATYYFTKWAEAKPMITVTQDDVIMFINEYILHRFGILGTIYTDNTTTFVESKMQEFAEEYEFKLTTSTSEYAQTNGQAESSNMMIKKIS